MNDTIKNRLANNIVNTDNSRMSINSHFPKIKNKTKQRKDRHGNKILKGEKKHSISFYDEVYDNVELANIIEVESYKEYYN